MPRGRTARSRRTQGHPRTVAGLGHVEAPQEIIRRAGRSVLLGYSRPNGRKNRPLDSITCYRGRRGGLVKAGARRQTLTFTTRRLSPEAGAGWRQRVWPRGRPRAAVTPLLPKAIRGRSDAHLSISSFARFCFPLLYILRGALPLNRAGCGSRYKPGRPPAAFGAHLPKGPEPASPAGGQRPGTCDMGQGDLAALGLAGASPSSLPLGASGRVTSLSLSLPNPLHCSSYWGAPPRRR